MTARDDFSERLRLAATYHADEGTSGWLLTEAQFDAIVAAADEYRAAGLRTLAAALESDAASVEGTAAEHPEWLRALDGLTEASAGAAVRMLRRAASMARAEAKDPS